MKIYISADIEGVTGIAHWDEARKSKADYQEFRRQMTQEVVAACEGAMAAYYPGAAHIGQRTVRFETKEYFEILRMLLFTT